MDEQQEFQRRLADARAKQGLDAPRQTPQDGLPPGPWGIGFRAGVEVVSALGVGILLGWLLDRWFGSFPLLFLVGFLAGAAAGVLNVYRLFDPRRSRR